MASRKLRITAAETMRTAEQLYTGGMISYPRTETNMFPPDLALPPLVEMQIPNPNWGGETYLDTVCLYYLLIIALYGS